MGKIDGNAPKNHKSTVTRRHVNYTNDIQGSGPKDRGSMPVGEKIRQEQLAMPRIRDYALAQKRGNDIMG